MTRLGDLRRARSSPATLPLLAEARARSRRAGRAPSWRRSAAMSPAGSAACCRRCSRSTRRIEIFADGGVANGRCSIGSPCPQRTHPDRDPHCRPRPARPRAGHIARSACAPPSRRASSARPLAARDRRMARSSPHGSPSAAASRGRSVSAKRGAARRPVRSTPIDWPRSARPLIAEIETADRRLRAARAIAGTVGRECAGRRPRRQRLSAPSAVPRHRVTPPRTTAGREHRGLACRARRALGACGRISPPRSRGRLEYLTDHREPGMLVGRILRAGIPHATHPLDRHQRRRGAARRRRGRHRSRHQGQQRLRHRRAGPAGALLRQGPPSSAIRSRPWRRSMPRRPQRALALIRVDYEPLPLVDGFGGGAGAGRACVHASGNLRAEFHHRARRYRGGLRRAPPMSSRTSM